MRLPFQALAAIALSTLATLGPLPARAGEPAGDEAGHALEARDLPADAPRFDSYPAQMQRTPRARLRLGKADLGYRTRLRRLAREPVNFAGRYILGLWGCGTSCLILRIIDTATGRVLPAPGLGSVEFSAVADSALDAGPVEGPVKFRTDSRLLVLLGAPEEDSSRFGIHYYAVEGERLRLLRHVAAKHAP